jgi:uncharacterized protein YecE (DUF72 family)
MIRNHFGCAGARGPLETYARRFDVLELDVLDRAARPKKGTLEKWRKEAGPSLIVSIVAPRALAAVRPGEALDAALADLLDAQRKLQARWVLVQTPVEVTPSELQKERLLAAIARIKEGTGGSARVAWEPRGMWEPSDAAKLCRANDVDLALDPLVDPREPFFDPALRYLRLGTVGGRTEYPANRLRYLADVLSSDREGEGDRLVIFSTPHAPREVKRLASLVEQSGGKVKGGGAVIRPRGSFSLPEEEDE